MSAEDINDKNPINNDKHNKRTTDRHQILAGNRLRRVISKSKHTKLNLQIGPAQIGEIRNINTAIILSLLSIILNQLLFPSTYCPTANLVRIFINLFELIQYFFSTPLFQVPFVAFLSKVKLRESPQSLN